MNAFNSDEQNIYDALSRITVNTNELAGQVKSRLHETTPCPAAPRRRRWPVSAVAAVALAVLLVGTAAAAALGGFDWFIEKFNPTFGEVAEPVEISCEDQGIRMEVIGAQKYGNKAIIYLSLQDVSGENRITEQTDFQDGFNVATRSQVQKMNGQGNDISSSSYSWSQKMLYFDEKSDTIYFEFNISVDSDEELSDSFEIGTSLIYFDSKDYEQEPLPLPLSGIGEAETISIVKNNIIGGGSVSNAGAEDVSKLKKVLAPGKYASLPLGDDNQWISNMGIVDGKLHVQIGKVWNEPFGSAAYPLLYLMTANGALIDADYYSGILCDKHNHPVTGYDDAAYQYNDYIFSVNADILDTCTLCYSGSVFSGVEGQWNATLNLGDTSQQMRTWTNDTPVDGCLFEHMILSPLGLQVLGSYEGEDCEASQMSVQVETSDGIIPLETGGGSYNGKDKTFILQWNTQTPLDVSQVTAVIINGTHIRVK